MFLCQGATIQLSLDLILNSINFDLIIEAKLTLILYREYFKNNF